MQRPSLVSRLARTAALLALVALPCAVHSQSDPSKPPLVARLTEETTRTDTAGSTSSNGSLVVGDVTTPTLKFKILQLADLHFTGDPDRRCKNPPTMHFQGENCSSCKFPDEIDDRLKRQRSLQSGTWPCRESYMSAFVDELLDAEKPDFVVFTGDNVETFAKKRRQRAIDAFTKGVEQRGIPFAIVLGNHDDENGFAREDVLRMAMDKNSSYTQRGPTTVDGVGNYHLSVHAPTDGPWGSASDTVFHMYFLDSGGYPDKRKYPNVDSTYDWIKPSQVEYYRNLSIESYATQQQQQQRNGQQINARGSANGSATLATPSPPLPAVMFFHIPLQEHNFPQEDAANVFGERNEGVASSSEPSGMFSALVERDEVKAVFVGHDHVNEYCYNRQGVQLCYGGGAGLGEAYGWSSVPRRARVIEWSVNAHGERRIRSWKRLYGSVSETCCHETLFPSQRKPTTIVTLPSSSASGAGADGQSWWASPLLQVSAVVLVSLLVLV